MFRRKKPENVYKPSVRCCFYCLIFACFCFVILFLLVLCLMLGTQHILVNHEIFLKNSKNTRVFFCELSLNASLPSMVEVAVVFS